jgi:Tfp pilus assembly protein PilF
MVIVKFIFLLGLLMAKYTTQDIKALAQLMCNESAANPPRPFTFITGAGVSFSGDIPLAAGLLKAINEHPHGEQVRDRLKCKDVADCDYGEAMGCLTTDERKDILEPILKKAKVNWGQIALAGMMKAGFVGRVLTFNFDNLLARASGMNGLYPSIYDFAVSPADSFDHIVTPAILHLHGQGHGLAILNSAEETKDHATKLFPLFKDTFEKAIVLVLGYSGLGDQAFEQVKAAYANRKRLYWCSFEEGAPKSHVEEILQIGKTTHKHLEGVDSDTFLIDLAIALEVFPPPLFSDTAQLLRDELDIIAVPPVDLRGAEGLIDLLNEDLEMLQSHQAKKPQMRILQAMMRRDWAAAIALESEAVSQADKYTIAWAYTMQGNAIADSATLKNDEGLFELSFEKFEAALKFKPDKHEALNNWGTALSGLARLTKDESTFELSFEKFEAALKIKPDDHEALNNWGTALSDLAKVKNDEGLFELSFEKFEAALKIKPDKHEALYNWGTALSDLARLKNDEGLFELSFEKFEAALKIKPDNHDALNNWGTALLGLARLKNDKGLFELSFEKFEAALKIKPDKHKVLNNWGTALSDLARLKNDEGLFELSFEKYEAALKLKPDKHEALNNWSGAIGELYHLNNDKLLLPRMKNLAAQAEKISGKPNYNLAFAYALQDKEAECQAQMLKCKAAGTLPDAAHLAVDDDMKNYWERDWFKALLV